jgi:hypothetical protein
MSDGSVIRCRKFEQKNIHTSDYFSTVTAFPDYVTQNGWVIPRALTSVIL